MKQDFIKFLKNRPYTDKNGWVRYKTNGQRIMCFHDETMWCQECIAEPQKVSQILPDGTISRGYLLGNIKL